MHPELTPKVAVNCGRTETSIVLGGGARARKASGLLDPYEQQSCLMKSNIESCIAESSDIVCSKLKFPAPWGTGNVCRGSQLIGHPRHTLSVSREGKHRWTWKEMPCVVKAWKTVSGD